MNVAVCTCFNIRKAARVVTQMYDAALRPAGLKSTQFSLLAVLAKRGDLPLTQLAEALVMDRTTLTRNIKPLVEKSLIRIEPAEDQRVRRISLTKHGRQAFELALPHWQEVQSRFVESLGHDRWTGFLADLEATVIASQSN